MAWWRTLYRQLLEVELARNIFYYSSAYVHLNTIATNKASKDYVKFSPSHSIEARYNLNYLDQLRHKSTCKFVK